MPIQKMVKSANKNGANCENMQKILAKQKGYRFGVSFLIDIMNCIAINLYKMEIGNNI